MTPDSGSGPLAPDLRSMLSRAVESELGEQRELTDAVSQIRVQLTRLNDEVGSLRARTSTEGASRAQVNTMTVELREAVRVLGDRMDRVAKLVAERSVDLTDIRTGLTVLDAHVRSQAETLATLSAGLQALPSYSDRVSVLQDNLQVLHRQLVGIEGSLSDAEAHPIGPRLDAIEAAISGVSAPQPVADDTVHEKIELVDDRLAAIEALTATLQSQLDPIGLDITAIGGAVAGLTEASSDGSVLDQRINEVVSHAVLDSEQRLKQHVDEAVLALAQTLLKRRAVVGAGLDPADVEESAAVDAVEDSGAVEDPAAVEETADIDGPVDVDLPTDADDRADAPDEAADAGPIDTVDDTDADTDAGGASDVEIDDDADGTDEIDDEVEDLNAVDESASNHAADDRPAWTAEVETDFWATPAPISLNGMSNGALRGNGMSPPTSLSAYRAELAEERSDLSLNGVNGDAADDPHEDDAVTSSGVDHGRRRKRRFGRD